MIDLETFKIVVVPRIHVIHACMQLQIIANFVLYFFGEAKSLNQVLHVHAAMNKKIGIVIC